MKGNKIENYDEWLNESTKAKYLDWELSNIKNCEADISIEHRIEAIFNLGFSIGCKFMEKESCSVERRRSV